MIGAAYFILGSVYTLVTLVGIFTGINVWAKGPIWFRSTPHLDIPRPFLIAGIVVYPFVCAVVGIISGFLLAWFYNTLARFLSGLQIEADQVSTNED